MVQLPTKVLISFDPKCEYLPQKGHNMLMLCRHLTAELLSSGKESFHLRSKLDNFLSVIRQENKHKHKKHQLCDENPHYILAISLLWFVCNITTVTSELSVKSV